MLTGKSTISMAMFNSYVNYRRVPNVSSNGLQSSGIWYSWLYLGHPKTKRWSTRLNQQNSQLWLLHHWFRAVPHGYVGWRWYSTSVHEPYIEVSCVKHVPSDFCQLQHVFCSITGVCWSVNIPGAPLFDSFMLCWLFTTNRGTRWNKYPIPFHII